MEERFVIEGKLGCPVCSASYSITGGIADLRDSAPGDQTPRGQLDKANNEDTAMRIAAMLGLTRPGSVAVLDGFDADIAAYVSRIASAKVISLNPSGSSTEAENVAAVLAGKRVPLGTASADGIMLADTAAPRDGADIARVLKPGGRIVIPVTTRLAGNFRELARDEKYIVAESTGPLLNLSR